MKRLRLSLLVLKFFAFCFSCKVEAQISDLPDHVLSLRMGITEPSIPLVVGASSASSTLIPDLEFRQNPSPKFGLGFDYQWLGVFVSVASLEPSQLVSDYGPTNYFDLEFHIYMSSVVVDLYFQRFHGYYLKNTSGVLTGNPALNEAGNLLRPDIASDYYGINFAWLNHPERMSMIAAGNSTAFQGKSGGTWMKVASIGHHQLSATDSLVPSSIASDYGVLGSLTGAKITTATFGIGYGYNWVFSEPWIFHFSILASLGPQYQDISSATERYTHYSIAAKGLGRLSLVRNGKVYFGGFHGVFDSTNFQVQGRNIEATSTYAMAFFGRRFDL